MNYLAHALDCLDDAYEVAGAAVPDWLCLTRPRLRCRSRHAIPHIARADPVVAAVARGVVRHHADDDWFHHTAAFADLSLDFARRIRRVTRDADGMRPSFVGHILVELLLDAAIHAEQPETLDRYYQALASVDHGEVARAVEEISGVDAGQLTSIIERFLDLRFLYDYADDKSLVFRLDQVMRRVGLAELPAGFAVILPDARKLVAERREELMTPLASWA